MNKRLRENILQKDVTIQKVQFDKIWYYSVKDMEYYLGESLEGADTVTLPITFEGRTRNIKCTSLIDINRLLESRSSAEEQKLVRKLRIK